MAILNFFQPFTEHLAEGVHNFQSHQLMVALCAAANAPDPSYATLSQLTQISYTNLGSRLLTVLSSSQSSGTYSLALDNLELEASGGSVAAYRYVIIYNDTPSSPADPLIGWVDRGADLVLAAGDSMLIEFGANLFTLSIAS